MNPIERILKDFPAMVLDGALSTELERRGCNLNDSLWSAKILMENPKIIGQVHTDYFAAGADCAITSSYQATIDGYIKHGLSEAEAVRLIQTSVHIAVQARDDFWNGLEDKTSRPQPIVAASVGPYGAYLADGSEYRGDYKLNEQELMEFHRPRIKALIAAGADILACETIPCMLEARAIAALLKEFPGVYAWISFSAKDELHVSNGERIADCAEWLDKHDQVAAIGVNCTSPKYVPSLINEISRQTKKPILVYPNSGEHYDASTRDWQGATYGESFSCSARSWYDQGAQLIGGCCRTNPDDIHSIAAWVRQLSTNFDEK
ncbi:homocysteine S-methyltransferase YbgG [Paenibacillus baekrokdamisoli]|uniref:S-methylmethionine:homocysteine methyltransferase n=1 Tax=Paenibacillus baekrokdamisoli TaxID=1712516 RepID=A0A3G9J252_9BACL|nr:homocysteine S-methyltransferase [Paenibacillus baekrokdamisoli]MBB3069265.1 homocysteine S-methyltransferase [Paenibacillus baekrokdamisoli]BBH18763.1 homocysteine S-methyltransferase YbgG [Paenibacillus baekrokdamisoli]